MKRVKKVFAYITTADEPCSLLVFAHVGIPAAGIQVPAGTVEPGEALAAAVMREAREETGLHGLRLRRFLGATEVNVRGEIHLRHFFHLEWPHLAGASWRHSETSGGKHQPIEFELFWARFPDEIPALLTGHDALLDELARSLSTR